MKVYELSALFAWSLFYHIFLFEKQVQRGSYLWGKGVDSELYPGRGSDRHPGGGYARGDALPRVVSAHAGGNLRRSRATVHHAVCGGQTSARRRQRDFMQWSEQSMLWSTLEISANCIANQIGLRAEKLKSKLYNSANFIFRAMRLWSFQWIFLVKFSFSWNASILFKYNQSVSEKIVEFFN